MSNDSRHPRFCSSLSPVGPAPTELIGQNLDGTSFQCRGQKYGFECDPSPVKKYPTSLIHVTAPTSTPINSHATKDGNRCAIGEFHSVPTCLQGAKVLNGSPRAAWLWT
ncbi:hypothetical protein AWENTII_001913 [Aspergillus wentii]